MVAAGAVVVVAARVVGGVVVVVGRGAAAVLVVVGTVVGFEPSSEADEGVTVDCESSVVALTPLHPPTIRARTSSVQPPFMVANVAGPLK